MPLRDIKVRSRPPDTAHGGSGPVDEFDLISVPRSHPYTILYRGKNHVPAPPLRPFSGRHTALEVQNPVGPGNARPKHRDTRGFAIQVRQVHGPPIGSWLTWALIAIRVSGKDHPPGRRALDPTIWYPVAEPEAIAVHELTFPVQHGDPVAEAIVDDDLLVARAIWKQLGTLKLSRTLAKTTPAPQMPPVRPERAHLIVPPDHGDDTAVREPHSSVHIEELVRRRTFQHADGQERLGACPKQANRALLPRLSAIRRKNLLSFPWPLS